jgi:hypothetical protein
MSVIRKSLKSTSVSSRKEEGTREGIEYLWDLYLTWRGRNVLPHHRILVSERPGSGFVLLGEIEETARVVLRTHLSEQIPFEFVMALMKSTADTTNRFMLANPTQTDRYRKIALEIFWNGLVTAGISGERKK